MNAARKIKHKRKKVKLAVLHLAGSHAHADAYSRVFQASFRSTIGSKLFCIHWFTVLWKPV